jgi:simple sugar transport system permease protein
VAIAMLANLQPLGVILASFFFAVIFTGSQTMSRYTGVPVYISDIMQGLTLITMLMVLLLNRYKIKISRK